MAGLTFGRYVIVGVLLILDEVQEIQGWVKVARQEIERNTHRIIITGSSASLLSKEIASSLAGRAIPEPILTLSYRDARSWQKLLIHPAISRFEFFKAVGI
jgi:predicted AAA+ superfamily ATPase